MTSPLSISQQATGSFQDMDGSIHRTHRTVGSYDELAAAIAVTKILAVFVRSETPYPLYLLKSTTGRSLLAKFYLGRYEGDRKVPGSYTRIPTLKGGPHHHHHHHRARYT